MSVERRDLKDRLAALKSELDGQGSAVAAAVDRAVEAVFEKNADLAAEVHRGEESIDALDVQIEKRAVRLLVVAAESVCDLDEADIRLVLTIVKVNNELERIADLAVLIAEQTEQVSSLEEEPPVKFRVMANSVIGMVQNTSASFAALDVDAARLVLSADDATEAFKLAILREIEEALADGTMSVDIAFASHTIAAALGRMADHCTNIAEQVIYVGTGKIIRHQDDKWAVLDAPEDEDNA